MALFFADLVREACWDVGAGDMALAGALPGHRTFAAAVPEGARFHYAIAGITDPEQWETGEGEIAEGKLVRTPLSSSADGETVDFSAGLKTIALTVSAQWFAARDGQAEIEDIAGLAEALNDKAPLDHSHGFAGLTGKPTTLAGYGISDAAAAEHDHDGLYQPLDADLSAVSGLATTSFGRAQLTLADAAALRGHAGLGSVAVKDVGTSGDTVPVLGGGAASWASGASFDGVVTAAGFNSNGGVATTVGVFRFTAGGTLAWGAAYAQASLTWDAGWAGMIAGAGNALRLGANGVGTQLILGTDGSAAFAGDLAIGGTLSIGGIQVTAARRTGWSAPSGTAARTTFDTASVTIEALAQRVKALIDDLAAHGLIGS